MRRVFIGLAAAAALHAVPAAAQLTPTALALPADGTILEIVAEGSSTRAPDLAVIQAGVTTLRPTAVEAMRQNAQQMAAVLAALKGAGIAARDIQTSDIALSPQYRHAENQPPVLTGYQATNTVSVRFRDIARSGTILDLLVAKGANNIQGPNLIVEKPQPALDEARVAAIATARARADLYAKAAGLSVVRMVSISESGGGTVPPMPMVRLQAAEPAPADTAIEAGERELSVSVTVRFLLK